MAVLGIDTSNYRTSVCLIDNNLKILSEDNPLLEVEQGEVGLQQSAALFQHLNAWPSLIKNIQITESIDAIGVSVRPRPLEGSYMPVFKVGEVLAETLAHFLSVPLYKTSHQEGHIAAGEHTTESRPSGRSFIAVHLSGGTSEVLYCTRTSLGYDIDKLGGTLDLHAGQFIDRVGVQLGLSFPAGPDLEQLAQQWEGENRGRAQTSTTSPAIPSYARGIDFSFSGPTTAAQRLIEKKAYAPGQIARAVEKNIAKTLEKSLQAAMSYTKTKDILIVGGVAANRFIANRLRNRLEHPATGGRLFFASPRYATDNAFGVACLTLKNLKGEK